MFYIYVDGYDLNEIALDVRTRIESFVARYHGRVGVVDQREDADKDSSDLPAWDLGVNFEFESLADVEKKDLLLFFRSLSAEFGRDFVVGRTSECGLPEDFVFILPAEPIEPAFALLTANARKS
jgi:hypothetical protein